MAVKKMHSNSFNIDTKTVAVSKEPPILTTCQRIKANIKAFVVIIIIIIIIVSLAHPFPTISINSHGRAWQTIIHVIMPNICRGSMDMGSSTKLMVNAWLGRRNMMTIIIRQHARQGNICAGMVCAQTAWEVDPTVSNCVKGLGMFGLDMVGHSNGCPLLFRLAALSFCYNGIPCQIIKKVCEATKKTWKKPIGWKFSFLQPNGTDHQLKD